MSPIQEKMLELEFVCCIFVSALFFWAGVVWDSDGFFVLAGIFGVMAAVGFVVFARASRR